MHGAYIVRQNAHRHLNIFYLFFTRRDRGLFKGDTVFFDREGGGGEGGLEKKPPVSQWSAGSCLCIILLTSSLRMVRWPSCECTGPQTE